MCMPMMKSIIILVLMVCITLETNAQKIITLSPRDQKSGRHKIVVSEGNRVKCKFIDGSKIVGDINRIMVDSIQINGKKFAVEDIKSMAKRKKGVTILLLGTQIVPAVAGAISVAAGNLPVAVGCLAIQVVGSILLVTPSYEYASRNVKYKWVLEVHDPPVKKY